MTTTTRLALAAASLLAALSTLHADDYTWNLPGAGAWDTTTENWAGAGSTWVNGSGNNAVFNAFGSGTTISFGTNITVGTLSTNGGSTINFFSGVGTSIDVTRIETAGTSGSAGSIDMAKVLTGNHDLTYHSTGTTNNQGRLNIKTAANYTGDTFLTGSAYMNLDGAANNLLPTGTTVHMDTGSTLRLGRAGASQQIAGLVSTNSGAGAVTGLAVGYTLTINTKSATTTTFSGSLSGNSTNTLNLVIDGSGTQALNGTNSFYGTTSISGGTLSLGGNISNTTSVTVNGGALTSSVSNVNLGVGDVSMSSGTLSPRGSATGTFTVAANQDLVVTGGFLDFNVGTAFDQIIGSGDGTFSISAATLALTLGAGFDYANSYSLFSGFSDGEITGLFITGYDTAGYVATLADTGVLSFTAVPEPSAFAALAGAGMLGFAALRRRRSR